MEEVRTAFSEQLRESWNNMLGQFDSWLNTLIINLPNLVLALLIVIFMTWLAFLVRKWSRKPLKRIFKEESVRSLISSFIWVTIMVFGILIAVGILNLNTVLKSMLAGAGIVGLAIGLALQGPLSNTFSGIFLAVKDVISVGDFIVSNGYSGVVTEIDLRNTKIKESDNNLVIIPNQLVLESPFKNYGLTRRMRVTVRCGVHFDTDLRQLRSVVREAIAQHFKQVSEEDVEFYFTEFGDHSIHFMVRFFVEATRNRSNLNAQSEAILTIKETLDAHGIVIPYPIRTLYRGDNNDGSKTGQTELFQ